MQAASTAAQAQAVAASTGASVPGAPKAAAEVRRYPNARAAYGIIARRAPALRFLKEPRDCGCVWQIAGCAHQSRPTSWCNR